MSIDIYSISVDIGHYSHLVNEAYYVRAVILAIASVVTTCISGLPEPSFSIINHSIWCKVYHPICSCFLLKPLILINIVA